MTVDHSTWSAYQEWALTDGRLSPRTTEKSARYLRFLETLGVDLLQLDRARYLQVLATARSGGRAPYTLNLWVTQLNRWVKFRGLEWKLPTYRHHHRADVPAPSREQVGKLWGLQWDDPGTTSRNRAIFAVLLDKGVRRQEVVDLNLGDFVHTTKGPSLVVRHGKGEKERTVPLAAETAQLLRTYVQFYRHASDQRALFTTPGGRISHQYLGKVVKVAGERIGLPWLSCHKLRHFAVDDLLDRGVSVTTVAEVVGHEKVETTMLYRTKRLGRLYAEREVRAADRGRFRSVGTAAGPEEETVDDRVGVGPLSVRKLRRRSRSGGYTSGWTSLPDEWTGRDLNPRPPVCKTGDLPADLPARARARTPEGG
jgi:site-specific recombinase XerD